MKLLWCELEDFRSYGRARLNCHPRANLLTGENGEGKTNLLEALYFLASATPLRGHRGADLIRQGSEKAGVRGEVELDAGGRAELRVVLSSEGRELFLRGKRVERAVEYFGNLEIVAFTPTDIQLFAASPAERRRFLDRMIFNHDPAYLDTARKFRRTLAQRNRLLLEIARGERGEAELDAWDGPYAELAAEVTRRRAALVRSVGSRLADTYRKIFGSAPDEPVEMRYRSEIRLLEENPAAETLRPWLLEKRRGDVRRGTTQLGPHRDEILFEIGGRPVVSHASQGQRRILLLALKLAEVLSLAEERRERPVVLLDDLSSELDAARAERALSCLLELGAQLFVTTTAEGTWGKVFGKDLSRFRVAGGTIEAA